MSALERFHYIVFEISTLEFVKNQFLNDIANFGSAFSEGPGSTFSDGLVPGLNLLYEGCPVKDITETPKMISVSVY